MRDWIYLCEKAYFEGYKDEMLQTIKENEDEFGEFVSCYLGKWVQVRSDGTYSLFYYFKNVIDYGIRYFINEFLKDDTWYNNELNNYNTTKTK